MDHRAFELIDQLIDCWSEWDLHEEYYLTVLIPSIVLSDGSAELMANEKEIINALRRLLSEEEWLTLPMLIAQRREHVVDQREAKRKEGEERRREDEEKFKQREIELQPRLNERHHRLLAEERAKRKKEEERRRKEEGERKQLEIKLERRQQERERAKRKEKEERRQAEKSRIERKRALVARLQEVFKSDFLSARRVLADSPNRLLKNHYT